MLKLRSSVMTYQNIKLSFFWCHRNDVAKEQSLVENFVWRMRIVWLRTSKRIYTRRWVGESIKVVVYAILFDLGTTFIDLMFNPIFYRLFVVSFGAYIYILVAVTLLVMRERRKRRRSSSRRIDCEKDQMHG